MTVETAQADYPQQQSIKGVSHNWRENKGCKSCSGRQ